MIEELRQYHLGELAIARDPLRREHMMPPVPPPPARVLDVGCGAGQTLIAGFPDRVSFGVDVDHEALLLGSSLTERVRFSQAKAEALPYRAQSFDMVVARVSLPYTHLPDSLSEIARVLKPQGRLWATLHPLRIPWECARHGSKLKAKLYFAYVTFNSVLFHLVQRQLAVRGKCESFQTRRGIRRALEQRGFEDIDVTMGPTHFVVTASKSA